MHNDFEELLMDKLDIIARFKAPPILRTPRLILRKLLKSDADDMFEYAGNPAVTKYLLWDAHASKKYTLRYLSYLQSRYKVGEFYDWAIVEIQSGKMIGTCGFTSFDLPNNSAEVGYVLNPTYWHRGIAAEALREMLHYAFEVLQLNRVEARYMLGNENSRRVMEKVGMTFEGVSREAVFTKGRYASVGTCSVLRNEFSPNPAYRHEENHKY